MFRQYKLKNYHFQLVIYMAALTIIGILIIGSAKQSVQGKQILGFIMGFIVMMVISVIDYSFLLKFVWVYYIGTLGLLLLVELVGDTTGGAQRWIDLGGFRFQPSEVAKIAIILFFSVYFMKHEENINSIKTLFISFVLVGIPLVLIITQPDNSTTILTTLIFIVLLFIGGLSYKIVLSVMGITIPIVIVALSYIITHAQKLAKDYYPIRRIMAWIDPSNPDYSSTAYQQTNSIMAIGSGQLRGKGLNNSVVTSMKNSNYISEPQTDFIFAVAGEELGFIGTVIIVILLLLIVIECILIARKAKDLAGRLICCGMAALVGFQAFINMCVATGLMPNTGIPLPFVSYGLTSLVSLYIGMGFVLNVGLQPKKY